MNPTAQLSQAAPVNPAAHTHTPASSTKCALALQMQAPGVAGSAMRFAAASQVAHTAASSGQPPTAQPATVQSRLHCKWWDAGRGAAKSQALQGNKVRPWVSA